MNPLSTIIISTVIGAVVGAAFYGITLITIATRYKKQKDHFAKWVLTQVDTQRETEAQRLLAWMNVQPTGSLEGQDITVIAKKYVSEVKPKIQLE